MICECGIDLGHVTVKTVGLCTCGRSKWMQCAQRIIPKSEAIAKRLNQEKKKLCRHHREPCISICGVMMVKGEWRAIDPVRRQQWFVNVDAVTRKQPRPFRMFHEWDH